MKIAKQNTKTIVILISLIVALVVLQFLSTQVGAKRQRAFDANALSYSARGEQARFRFDFAGGDYGTPEIVATRQNFVENRYKITVPKKEGFVFGGYYGAPDGEGFGFWRADGSPNQNGSDGATNGGPNDRFFDRILYANWVLDKNEYSINFDNRGGDSEESTLSKKISSALPKVSVPQKAYATFEGYYLDEQVYQNNLNIAMSYTMGVQRLDFYAGLSIDLAQQSDNIDTSTLLAKWLFENDYLANAGIYNLSGEKYFEIVDKTTAEVAYLQAETPSSYNIFDKDFRRLGLVGADSYYHVYQRQQTQVVRSIQYYDQNGTPTQLLWDRQQDATLVARYKKNNVKTLNWGKIALIAGAILLVLAVAFVVFLVVKFIGNNKNNNRKRRHSVKYKRRRR